MEVKVFVEDIQRVVCGVTEDTLCQEVVLALAQALSQPGRYTLKEKFKDFERCLTPDEHLLETMERYGEQVKDVQLHLIYKGPSMDQLCPPLRRKDAGGRTRRHSSSLSLHRQSLPPLNSFKQEAEPNQENLKIPKRKSLTLMEEAWDWLENLRKGKVYNTCNGKEPNKKTDVKNQIFVSLADGKMSSDQNRRSKAGVQRGQQTSCCIGSQTRSNDSKHSKKTQETDVKWLSNAPVEDEKHHLRKNIIFQLKYLQDLQLQIAHIDKHILELEKKEKAQFAEQEVQERLAEEEMAQMQFWENELRAEEGFEKDLQCQFIHMRAKAVEYKVKLDDYKNRLEGLEFCSTSSHTQQDLEVISKDGKENAGTSSAVRSEHNNQKQSESDNDANVNRKFPPNENPRPRHAPAPLHQIRERRPTGPRELREWWTRWSETKSSPSQSKKKVIHRSELTIHLCSTKV